METPNYIKEATQGLTGEKLTRKLDQLADNFLRDHGEEELVNAKYHHTLRVTDTGVKGITIVGESQGWHQAIALASWYLTPEGEEAIRATAEYRKRVRANAAALSKHQYNAHRRALHKIAKWESKEREAITPSGAYTVDTSTGTLKRIPKSRRRRTPVIPPSKRTPLNIPA